MAVVAEDNTWLVRSTSASGEVDPAAAPFMIPIDAAAVDPRTFGEFLPPADRDVGGRARARRGRVGSTSAELRGLGPGATLTFESGTKIRIAAVLPDELVGAAELMVSRRSGLAIGVDTERYVLLRPSATRLPTSAKLTHLLEPLLPASIDPVDRKVQVARPARPRTCGRATPCCHPCC